MDVDDINLAMDFSGLGGSRHVYVLMDKLGLSEAERLVFGAALNNGDAGRSAVVLTELAPEEWKPRFCIEPLSWMPAGVYPVMHGRKAGTEEGFEQGWFYPLDLSSVWESMALSQVDLPVRRFLDMCAAPGGKSILTCRRMKPEEHYANEIDPGRLRILRHNLKRCGMKHGYTQRLSPRVWAERAPVSFDLVWVDAPCSGQSLLAKGIVNPGCFRPATVKGNAKRQRGILASSAACVASGGTMAYSTCSYSIEENEQTVEWFLKKFPEFATVDLPALSLWRSGLSENFCYRLMPHHSMGAGGFVTLFRRSGEPPAELPEMDEDLTAYPVNCAGSSR